jgi:hypothetical protein
MNDTGVHFFHRAAADGEAIAIFSGIAESGRYPDPRDVWKVAGNVCGAIRKPNRDSAWFELAHFCAALSRCGIIGSARFGLLLGLETVTPVTIRLAIAELAEPPRSIAFERTGLKIYYPSGTFSIHYSRMPVLLGLYDYISAIDDYGFFAELQTMLDNLASESGGEAAVKAVAARMASRMRTYRRTHMAYGRREEKFDRLSAFLTARAGDGSIWRIDDVAVFDFWKAHAGGDDFRSYRTCYDGFLKLIAVLDQARAGEAALNAVPVGSAGQDGELDVPDQEVRDLGEWSDPLAVFESGGLSEIKFFKASSERRPLETLMRYGPDIFALPLGYFRHECFGAIQAAITADLQLKRGAESVRSRLDCSDAEHYRERLDSLDRLSAHLRRLQYVVLHYIAGEDVPDDLRTLALREVKRLKRKGFDPDDRDAERRLLFAEAASALVTMSDHLARCRKELGRLEPALATHFDADRDEFSSMFHILYGETDA